MSVQTTSQEMIKGGIPTIFVTDMATAAAFYTEILGLRLQYRAGDHFAMIDVGDGLSLGLHPRPRPRNARVDPGRPERLQASGTGRRNASIARREVWATRRGARSWTTAPSSSRSLATLTAPACTSVKRRSRCRAPTSAINSYEPRRSIAARQARRGAHLKLSRNACPAVSPATSRRARCGTRP